MIDHSKSLSSYRRAVILNLLAEIESDHPSHGNPIYEFVT